MQVNNHKNSGNFNFFLGSYEDAILRLLKTLRQKRIVERIWSRDFTVWKPKPDGIVNRLGWLDAPADTLKQLSYIQSVIKPIIKDGCSRVVLLGMGGSSLAAEVFNNVIGPQKGWPTMTILDTTNPATINEICENLPLEKTVFIVSSKSGTTMETISLFHFFYRLAARKMGNQASRKFIVITDPDSPLEELSYRKALRHVFLSNTAVGGRYSALSFPGIIPAACIGIDVEYLLQNALAAVENEKPENFSGRLNASGIVLGAVLGLLAQRGRNKLTIITPPQWASFGNWLEQLLAESTGKESRGILPVCGESLYKPEYYGNDRVFVIFYNKKNRNLPDKSALTAAGHPAITIGLTDKYELGGQMFLWEMATVIAGHILAVNPFDQPDVESTKIITRRLTGLYREKQQLPQDVLSCISPECNIYGYKQVSSPREALEDFLAQTQKGTYVCFHVYLNPAPETVAALQRLRKVISNKYRIVVTIGYGPRYLHSTGQLHKGDAGEGLFIQLTADHQLDLPIPDSPDGMNSTLTFANLLSAQAMGDRQALIALGRKYIHFHLKKNTVANIIALANHLQKK